MEALRRFMSAWVSGLRRRNWNALVAFSLLSAAPALVHADILYSLTYSSSPGALYTINSATGAATPLVSLTGIDSAETDDISFLNGTLYASNIFRTQALTASFGTINLSTGVFTQINTQGGSVDWRGMAANPGANLFYVVETDGTGEPLLAVTPTGTITTIGLTNDVIDDLAYDANHNILYGINGTDLLETINTSTGATTVIGSTGLVGNIAAVGLAYDSTTNTLYMNDGVGHNLYTLNTATGAKTLVGSNGTSAVLDGMADIGPSTPEPGTLLLMALGMPALAMTRRAVRRCRVVTGT
jgi:PEP-CTERM motif